MQFVYQNRVYDLRFKPKYLPKPFREIYDFDMATLLNRNITREYKQRILARYSGEAIIVS